MLEEQAPDTVRDFALKGKYTVSLHSELNQLKLTIYKNDNLVDTQSGFKSLEEISNYLRFIIMLEENK